MNTVRPSSPVVTITHLHTHTHARTHTHTHRYTHRTLHKVTSTCNHHPTVQVAKCAPVHVCTLVNVWLVKGEVPPVQVALDGGSMASHVWYFQSDNVMHNVLQAVY